MSLLLRGLKKTTLQGAFQEYGDSLRLTSDPRDRERRVSVAGMRESSDILCDTFFDELLSCS